MVYSIRSEGMNLNISCTFNTRDNVAKCTLRLNGKCFKGSRKITKQADQISDIKRAKQSAYAEAMVKLHGYVCRDLINEEEEE